VYAFAGHPVAKAEIKVMPLWIMIPLASTLEWAYWVFTLGTKQPELRRWDMEYFTRSVAWKIDKAKKVLGYEPVADQDEILKKCIESCMEHCGMKVSSRIRGTTGKATESEHNIVHHFG
jgi:sterol-4alpha-carboxylate 3-dehydrogenase (decarboxylating)